MFGLRLTTKRELALYGAKLQEYREEIDRLHQEVIYHRDRAEKAVNILLAKTQNMVMNLDRPLTEDQEDEIEQKRLDLFGDGETQTEKEALEKLQE